MLKYLAGPIIGMIIGYCTNYIAVKMLFRPRTEKYFLGHRVPLTPGAIPKGKTRLASAVGEVVAKYLITEDDIAESLLEDEAEDAVVDRLLNMLNQDIRQDIVAIAGDGQNYDRIIEQVDDAVTAKVLEAVSDMDIAGMVGDEGRRIIMNMTAGTMLAMFVNEDMINQIMNTVCAEISSVIEERGEEFVRPAVSAKMTELRDSTITELLGEAGIDEERVREILAELYRSAVRTGVSKMIRQIDIAGMIEAKINEMSVEELEVLVLSVMKHELNTIVNLGALIGFVLGCLNIVL